MVKIGNERIIDNQMSALSGFEFEEIIIVGGYLFEKLKNYVNLNFRTFKNITFINNLDYLTTNNMYSFYLAKEKLIDNDFILMNSDIYFDKTIIRDLIDSNISNVVVCDDTLYNDESMKIIVKDNLIQSISNILN